MKFVIPLVCLLLSAGCASRSSSKSEKHQMEMNLHKVRIDVDEIKHDLNTYEIEHHVLEGKLIDQEQNIASLKKEIAELEKSKMGKVSSEIQNLDKKIALISKKQDTILSDIRQLSLHANETTTALSQYKEKMTQFEKAITIQEEQIRNIIKFREGLSRGDTSHSSGRLYTVRVGDSLEKIAREQNTTVGAIKQVNALSTDLIVVGQKLELP